jgi:RES domain-containing protein
MRVYRIARKQFARDLSGIGAELFGGRWNSVGIPMLYCAESTALAQLEALVHLPNQGVPLDHELVTIEIPDTAPIEEFPLSELSQILSDLGKTDNGPFRLRPPAALTKKIGDDFVNARRNLALKVPSIIVPESSNYLMNPKHPLAESIRIVSAVPFSFDSRLFHS